tara:strand:- start:2971 stop:3105 length:135 start_codon:yes stop_codon:yes gene_type:complete
MTPSQREHLAFLESGLNDLNFGWNQELWQYFFNLSSLKAAEVAA